MSGKSPDYTGKSLLARNIIFGWATQVLVTIAGFIIPRQISDSLGVTALGVWDVGWATFRYLSIVNVGSTSALTRFVALYRADGRWQHLHETVTSAVVWQVLAASFALLVGAGVLAWGEQILTMDSGAESSVLVIWWFCVAVAVKMLGDPAGGVITGCHRWDVQHSISAGQDVLLAVLVVAAVLAGGNVVQLSQVVAGVTALATVARMIAARRLLPDVRVGRAYWHWRRALDVMRFGAKSAIASGPKVIIFQSATIALAMTAGYEVVAVLNRSVSLINMIVKAVTRVALMLVPMTSGTIGTGKTPGPDTLLAALRFSFGMSVLACCLYTALTPLVVAVWMGPAFVHYGLVVTLGIGALFPIAQFGPFSILAGMNAHGRVALASLAAALLFTGASLGGLLLAGQLDLVTTAMAIGVSWTMSRGVVVLVQICRQIKVPVWHHLAHGVLAPVVYGLPLLLATAAALWLQMDGQVLAALAVTGVGLLLTLVVYWLYLLDPLARVSILRFFGRWLPARWRPAPDARDQQDD